MIGSMTVQHSDAAKTHPKLDTSRRSVKLPWIKVSHVDEIAKLMHIFFSVNYGW